MCLRLPTVRPLARQHTEFQCTPCSQDSVADLLQDVHLDEVAHKMPKAEKQRLKKRLAKLPSAAKCLPAEPVPPFDDIDTQLD